nr:hypothetical protein [Actinoplanes abujensis]
MAEPEFAAAAQEAGARRSAAYDDPYDARLDDPYDDQRETVQFDPGDLAAARPSAGPDFSAAADGPAYADHADTAVFADQAGAAPAGDLSADEARRRDLESPDHERAPDYERASDAINAARSEASDEDAWPRRPENAAGSGPDEFAEPDDDDPDDEPLPQSVQPADAVRVARLDAEVLVVDGRPRYHVADCPSLAGRLAEPIPVREAVELGFSPCGLCRPVDRLVGADARR